MGKYVITHACGHDEEVTLFGKYEDREYKIKKMEAKDCVDCRAALITDLEGSPKQKIWAFKIRDEFCRVVLSDKIKQMMPLIDDAYKYSASPDYDKALSFLKSLIDIRDNKVGAISSAKWWIDNRFIFDCPRLFDSWMDVRQLFGYERMERW